MKNIVKVVLIVLAVAAIFGCGLKLGLDYGYNNGHADGMNDGIYKAEQEMEDWSYDNVNRMGSYYGYDGITVRYYIEEGNINDNL